MDVINKMTVPELKSILREHKKIHYQPYSKLNRERLIKLIAYYKLHETDLSKHIKVKRIRVKTNRGSKSFMQKIRNKEVDYDFEPPVKRKQKVTKTPRSYSQRI